MMKFNIEKEVSRDVLENIFVTALEGGSNYWYHIGNEAIDIIREAVTDKDGKAFSEMLFETVYDHGKAVPIGYIEDMGGEPIGVINYNTIKDGLQKMIDTGDGWALLNEISEQGDTESSDVCFQYMVLGEVIYG
jgi:hypothetical protein